MSEIFRHSRKNSVIFLPIVGRITAKIILARTNAFKPLYSMLFSHKRLGIIHAFFYLQESIREWRALEGL